MLARQFFEKKNIYKHKLLVRSSCRDTWKQSVISRHTQYNYDIMRITFKPEAYNVDGALVMNQFLQIKRAG